MRDTARARCVTKTRAVGFKTKSIGLGDPASIKDEQTQWKIQDILCNPIKRF